MDLFAETTRIAERRRRGVKYIVIGTAPNMPETEIVMDSESSCNVAAQHWVRIYGGYARCFCVQDGEIGGRPFNSFWGKWYTIPS